MNESGDENWETGTLANPRLPRTQIALNQYAIELANIAYPLPIITSGQTNIPPGYPAAIQNQQRVKNQVMSLKICPTEINNATLINQMAYPFNLVSGINKYWNLEADFPNRIYQRFLQNSRDNYYVDARVEKLIYESSKGKEMIKNIVSYFHKTIKDHGLNYENKLTTDVGNLETVNIKTPSFVTEGYGVLFCLMGGTQYIRVLVKQLNIANNEVSSELVIQLMDVFGADEDDWATKFGPQTNNWKLAAANQLSNNETKKALVAFYALQKQRGYNPFRVINTFKITLDKVSLNAIAD